jgi:hypothetical protein
VRSSGPILGAALPSLSRTTFFPAQKVTQTALFFGSILGRILLLSARTASSRPHSAAAGHAVACSQTARPSRACARAPIRRWPRSGCSRMSLAASGISTIRSGGLVALNNVLRCRSRLARSVASSGRTGAGKSTLFQLPDRRRRRPQEGSRRARGPETSRACVSSTAFGLASAVRCPDAPHRPRRQRDGGGHARLQSAACAAEHVWRVPTGFRTARKTERELSHVLARLVARVPSRRRPTFRPRASCRLVTLRLLEVARALAK